MPGSYKLQGYLMQKWFEKKLSRWIFWSFDENKTWYKKFTKVSWKFSCIFLVLNYTFVVFVVNISRSIHTEYYHKLLYDFPH